MKAPLSSKNYVTLALVVMVLSLMSSCRDQEFDWDAARANTQRLKFDDAFIKEFGKPAEGHQWGFDMATLALGGDMSYENISSTRAVYKQEMIVPGTNTSYGDYLGKPANITQKEHDEVYAWFTNHKVTWVTTPTYCENGESTRDIVGGVAKVINTDYTAAKYGSLKDTPYSTINADALGDYVVNESLHFRNAWVQHVASNKNNDEVEYVAYTKNRTPYLANDAQNYINKSKFESTGEIELLSGKTLKGNMNKAEKMNYLCCWGYNTEGAGGSWQDHINDFNAGSGYGYGRQDNQNGVLVTNADVTNWTYGNSLGSSLPHDKYYIVYLEGDGYKGWYLGFDFESWGDNVEHRVPGDGICNDWIIKLVNFGDNTPYNPARIMCEDLGGDSNITGSDIDYNDIVLDVKNNNDHSVTLTLQAAGGTLPLIVTYGNTPLFETHELFQNPNKNWKEVLDGNGRYSVDYSIMYNTGESGGDNTAKPFNIYFKGYTGTKVAPYAEFSSLSDFVFGDLQIKVYRYGVDDYKANGSKMALVSEWVDLGNEAGVAPLKFCVPNTVKWLKERQSVKKGYPGFLAWVTDPSVKFWEKTPVSGYLYGSGVDVPTTPLEPENPESPVVESDIVLSNYGTTVQCASAGNELKISVADLPASGSSVLSFVYKGEATNVSTRLVIGNYDSGKPTYTQNVNTRVVNGYTFVRYTISATDYSNSSDKLLHYYQDYVDPALSFFGIIYESTSNFIY